MSQLGWVLATVQNKPQHPQNNGWTVKAPMIITGWQEGFLEPFSHGHSPLNDNCPAGDRAFSWETSVHSRHLHSKPKGMLSWALEGGDSPRTWVLCFGCQKTGSKIPRLRQANDERLGLCKMLQFPSGKTFRSLTSAPWQNRTFFYNQKNL